MFFLFFFIISFFFFFFFFFFNDTATTEIYTLSLHDALPIASVTTRTGRRERASIRLRSTAGGTRRSEEHTSELQSRFDIVCRRLLAKKKQPTARGSSSTIGCGRMAMAGWNWPS